MSKLRELISAIGNRNDPEMVKLVNEMTIHEVNAIHKETVSHYFSRESYSLDA